MQKNHGVTAFIKGLRHAKTLPPIAWALCEELYAHYESVSPELMLCIVQLCLRMREGDVCLHLSDGKRLKDGIFTAVTEALDDDNPEIKDLSLADEEGMRDFKELLQEKFGRDFGKFTQESLKRALDTPAVTISDSGEEISTPLCFERGRLYFKRYLCYERDIAAFVKAKGSGGGVLKNSQDLDFAKYCLNTLFGSDGDNRQKWAAALALLSGFTVISGGPGTGKTTTVSKLLLVLLSCMLKRNPGATPRVLLAAPTGKAAGRLGESLEMQLKSPELQCFAATVLKDLKDVPEVAALIPRRAQTVHHLLGVYPHSSSCRHNREAPLNCDVLVIDEVSMVDLPLFAKLCAAVPPHCVLILLGDKDQLTSVEAGSVMADLCANLRASGNKADQVAALSGCPKEHTRTPGAMSDHVMLLTKSYRFTADSGIGTLARLVNGTADRKSLKAGLADILSEGRFKDIGDRRFKAQDCAAAMRSLADFSLSPGYGYRPFYDYLVKQNRHMDAPHAAKAFALLDGYRILCSNRSGLCGTNRLNAALANTLRQEMAAGREEWFAGRVIIVTRNNPAVGVHNGDVGFCAYDQSDRLRVWFPGDNGEAHAVNPVYLTEVEDGYALTVHKSQGSEYHTVALCISEHDNSVLTRELVYTGITRAKKKLLLYAVPEILELSCARTVQRESGLAERL